MLVGWCCGYFFLLTTAENSAGQLFFPSPLVSNDLRLSPALSTPSTGLPNSNAESAVCSNASVSVPNGTIAIETPSAGLPSTIPHSAPATVAVSTANVDQGPVDAVQTVPKSSSLNSFRNGTTPTTSLADNPMSQDTLGSSLGLPPEFLPSWSYSSSGVGSESEGDTVRSALASALGLLGHSTEGSALLSMGASLEGTSMGASSLSQSARSLPRDPDSPTHLLSQDPDSRNDSPIPPGLRHGSPTPPDSRNASPTHLSRDPDSRIASQTNPNSHNSPSAHPPGDPELSGISPTHRLPPRELLSPESIEVCVVARAWPIMPIRLFSKMFPTSILIVLCTKKI